MEPETMRQPVAYLRRSRVDTRRPGTVSHEQQLAAVLELAAKHGDTPEIIEDWGRSGRDAKLGRRTGFARLRAMVKRGEVGAVYAYDVSRLGRSVVTLHQLMDECQKAGVPIRCATGYSPDITTAEGRLVFGNLSSMFQYLAESAQERAQRLTRDRKEHGDDLGPPPFGWRSVRGKHVPNPAEDVSKVVGAYREAGSITGACKLLNDPSGQYHARTRRGGLWRPSTVSQVLEAAEARDRRPQRGRPTSRTYALSGLLRCHCGTILTGQRNRTTVGYMCRRARFDPTHGYPLWASEKRLMPWVRDEAARLEIPDQEPGDVEAEPAPTLGDLAARRRRVIDLYKSGLIDRDERDADLAAIGEAMEAIDRTPPVVELENGIAWDVSPEALNGQLRALWERIDLGPDMRPVAALWRVPEWRA